LSVASHTSAESIPEGIATIKLKVATRTASLDHLVAFIFVSFIAFALLLFISKGTFY
jgi:hypothetical protein